MSKRWKGRAEAVLKPNQCGTCRAVFRPETQVILTRSGTVTCATHRAIFVPESIVAEGPWSEIRTQRPA